MRIHTLLNIKARQTISCSTYLPDPGHFKTE